MRRHRFLVWGVALLLVASGLVAVLLWPRSDGPVSRARCERVQIGMTQAEVEAVLGGPPGDYRTDDTEQNTFDHWSVLTEPGFRPEWWWGDDGVFWVSFDAQDRVVAHSPGPGGRVTLIDKLLAWLGF